MSNKIHVNGDELPEKWEWISLSSLVSELETGSRPKGGVRGITDGVLSVGGEHLNSNGGFDFSTPRYVPSLSLLN